MAGRIIKKLIKIILGIITYLFAIFFFVSEVNRTLDFCPMTVHEAFANMQTISPREWVRAFFADFMNMVYPVGVLASITEIPALLRILLGGLWSEIEYEFRNARDIVRVGDRSVVGNTAIRGSLLVIIVRLALIWIVITLMFLVKPFVIVKDIIELIIMLIAGSVIGMRGGETGYAKRQQGRQSKPAVTQEVTGPPHSSGNDSENADSNDGFSYLGEKYEQHRAEERGGENGYEYTKTAESSSKFYTGDYRPFSETGETVESYHLDEGVVPMEDRNNDE